MRHKALPHPLRSPCGRAFIRIAKESSATFPSFPVWQSFAVHIPAKLCHVLRSPGRSPVLLPGERSGRKRVPAALPAHGGWPAPSPANAWALAPCQRLNPCFSASARALAPRQRPNPCPDQRTATASQPSPCRRQGRGAGLGWQRVDRCQGERFARRVRAGPVWRTGDGPEFFCARKITHNDYWKSAAPAAEQEG